MRPPIRSMHLQSGTHTHKHTSALRTYTPPHTARWVINNKARAHSLTYTRTWWQPSAPCQRARTNWYSPTLPRASPRNLTLQCCWQGTFHHCCRLKIGSKDGPVCVCVCVCIRQIEQRDGSECVTSMSTPQCIVTALFWLRTSPPLWKHPSPLYSSLRAHLCPQTPSFSLHHKRCTILPGCLSFGPLFGY